MTKSFTRALALIVALSGCSLIDTTDGPAITFEDRLCNTNSDCIGLESTLVDLDGITTRPCIVIGTECNTSRNRCVVTVEEINDVDGDGEAAMACGGNDCDDTRATVKPGAREACDGFISDCSAANGGTPRPAEDADGDEFARSDAECEPGGFPKTDCDDTNPNTYPGAPEVCDGEINTCETLGPRALEDMDGDAHAAPNADCLADIGNVNVYTKDDCDDANGSTYPGAPEVCDRIFNDCSSTMPRVVEDADNDGRASFLASCSGGPIPKDECVGADLDATTRYCAPTEMLPLIDGVVASFLNPNTVAVLNLDGSGGLDVVTSNSTPTTAGQLRRCLGGGGGAFTCSVLNPTFSLGATQFRTGNVNGAGNSDVLFAFRDANVGTPSRGLQWFSTSGVPTDVFPSVAVLGSVVFNTLDVGAAGATGTPDGDTDVVVIDRTQSTGNGDISLYTNTAGVFAETVVAAAVPNPFAIAAAEFDGDGIVDVVVSTQTAARIYLSGGNAFGTWTLTTLAAPFSIPSSVEAGDLDDDGDSDFVVGNFGSGDLLVFLNTGGVFTPVSVFPDGTPAQQRFAGVSTVVLRDYDLDGDLDIGATSSDLDSVAWWETVGSSVWLRHDIVTDLDAVSALAVGDLDGDGDEDLVASATGADTLSWWRTHYVSDIGFSEQRVDRAFDGAREVALDDFDGDGDLDVVAAANGGGNVTVWINVDGEGTVLAEIPVEFGFASVRAVVTGDLDGDGDVDVAAMSDSTVRWWANAGTGRVWSSATTVATTTLLDRLTVGDIDGDDDLDLAASLDAASGSVLLFTNDGAGAFVMGTIGAVANPGGLVIEDIDADDDGDVLVTSITDGQVYLFTNGGSSFVRSTVGGGGLPNAEDLTVADVNRDTRLDVVAVSIDGTTHFYANSPTGFTAPPVVVGGSRGNFLGSFVRAADLDSDGDLDVITSLVNANSLLWFESTARDGTEWIAHRVSTFGASVGPAGIDVGDIDHDGNVDIASTLNFADDVVWWKSDGAAWWNP